MAKQLLDIISTLVYCVLFQWLTLSSSSCLLVRGKLRATKESMVAREAVVLQNRAVGKVGGPGETPEPRCRALLGRANLYMCRSVYLNYDTVAVSEIVSRR